MRSVGDEPSRRRTGSGVGMPGPKPHLRVVGDPASRPSRSVAVGTRIRPSFPSESDETDEGEIRGVRCTCARMVGTPDSWPAPSPGPVGDSEKTVRFVYTKRGVSCCVKNIQG